MEVPTPAKEIIFFSWYEYLHGSELTGRRAVGREQASSSLSTRRFWRLAFAATDRSSWLAVLTTELALPVIPLAGQRRGSCRGTLPPLALWYVSRRLTVPWGSDNSCKSWSFPTSRAHRPHHAYRRSSWFGFFFFFFLVILWKERVSECLLQTLSSNPFPSWGQHFHFISPLDR